VSGLKIFFSSLFGGAIILSNKNTPIFTAYLIDYQPYPNSVLTLFNISKVQLDPGGTLRGIESMQLPHQSFFL
jgi:hypothetical protein